MKGQVAVGSYLCIAVVLGIGGRHREVSDQLAPSAEIARRRDISPVGMGARDLVSCICDGSSGLVNMPSPRKAAHLDALQHLRLKRRAVSLQLFELVGACRLFERGHAVDSELAIKLADEVGLQARNA